MYAGRQNPDNIPEEIPLRSTRNGHYDFEDHDPYRKSRPSRWRSYAFTALICFCFVLFVFFIKVIDCSHEDCFEVDSDSGSWTLQCLIGLSIVAMLCVISGTICIIFAKYRELQAHNGGRHGYEEI